MKRFLSIVVFLCGCSVLAFAQHEVSLRAALPQQSFGKVIPPGNYSGLSQVRTQEYVVVDDKSLTDGFHQLRIVQDARTGAIDTVFYEGFVSNGGANRDGEGIVYHPSTHTVFISGESDSRIAEYDIKGMPTGRTIQLPPEFLTHTGNYGLESLGYNEHTHLFWTTTESTLPMDGAQATSTNGVRNILRLQSFDEDLKPARQYLYQMDAPVSTSLASLFAMGVSDILALDDGQLIILEREFFVPKAKLGSYVNCKLYVVDPQQPVVPSVSQYIPKRLLYELRTKLTLFSHDIANYEGMSLGATLQDGSQSVILVSDSQNHYAGILKDYFKVLILR